MSRMRASVTVIVKKAASELGKIHAIEISASSSPPLPKPCMRLPKYSNPHLIPDDTRIVSRRSLQLEDGVGDDVMEDEGLNGAPSLEVRKDVEDLYKRLDKIVSKRFKLKRVLEASDESSSIKRRKILAEEREGQPAGLQRLSEPVGKKDVSFDPPGQAVKLLL